MNLHTNWLHDEDELMIVFTPIKDAKLHPPKNVVHRAVDYVLEAHTSFKLM